MTHCACNACRPEPGTPERSEWEAGYAFTAERIRYWNDDIADEDRYAAESNLADDDLSSTQQAYWQGVQCAALQSLGEPCPQCSCGPEAA